MKLAAIKKLCTARKIFYILNDPDGRQWLSDTRNAYPVEGVRITADSIPALFDLAQKQADKMSIREISVLDERFSVEPMGGERELGDLGAVWYAGDLYRVMGNAQGLLMVPVSALKPAESKYGMLRFFERISPEGNILIARYGDMLVSGLVSPVDAKHAEAIMQQVQMLSLQAVRVSASPETDAEAEEAERAAEEAIRRDQQRMDLGSEEDEEPEDDQQ